MIEVEKLCKTYGSTVALRDVSFAVEPGAILGFLGPNGAGKTTTLRILAAYLPATSGTARIAGFDVHEKSMDVRQRIGYLPENPPLYPGLQVLAFSASKPPVSPGLFLLAHLGLILLAAGILSLGMFISSLTDSTILAAVFTFALVLFLWVIDLIGGSLGGVLGEGLKQLSLISSYTNFIRGIVDSSSIVLLASYIILGVFLTAQSIDALRFQRS
ncbi:ATP-binding cassette domain-containing protein [Planktothrix agardhii 1031]|uniref:ATP-binding cassette domain-containing protein n=1 Tax=Planktothrix agardhii TaxID=1160 RepID=UPI001D09C5D5|nr:ATP-binding cassette domain-containing protein [Planktothrix agardhii]MCB8779250.1 ATP-binding cassette domain-containing protein [Planktothrix agardhii 1031]